MTATSRLPYPQLEHIDSYFLVYQEKLEKHATRISFSSNYSLVKRWRLGPDRAYLFKNVDDFGRELHPCINTRIVVFEVKQNSFFSYLSR